MFQIKSRLIKKKCFVLIKNDLILILDTFFKIKATFLYLNVNAFLKRNKRDTFILLHLNTSKG